MTQFIEVRRKVLEVNDRKAEQLRRRFLEQGTLVTNFISSPGSGKTTLLETTVQRLWAKFSCAVLVGDVATERDADRIRHLGIPARQILTGGACHLEAGQIETSLDRLVERPLNFLFIENVGNLICPTAYDLGEDFKVALLSVAEGDDKPFKYPGIFSHAQVTLVTKIDLLPYVNFDVDVVHAQVASLNPSGRILALSSRTGEGVEEWCEMLLAQLEAKRAGVGDF